MLWSWYVADDTQFYVVGAVILILATNHFKIAAFSLITLLVSSWLTTGYIALINNHMPSIDDPLALFDKIYDKPWTRLGPYLIGMAVGYFLFKIDCKVKMSKVCRDEKMYSDLKHLFYLQLIKISFRGFKWIFNHLFTLFNSED